MNIVKVKIEEQEAPEIEFPFTFLKENSDVGLEVHKNAWHTGGKSNRDREMSSHEGAIPVDLRDCLPKVEKWKPKHRYYLECGGDLAGGLVRVDDLEEAERYIKEDSFTGNVLDFGEGE